MPSLRKNIAYKGLLSFSNYVIGFVTFPYVTRVLGPENFGQVNFALNTVDYFLLFATLGVTTIGTREIAALRDDSARRDSAFSGILGLNLIFTLMTLAVFLGLVWIVPKFRACEEMMLVGTAKILFTALSVEWFFTGMENFRYITLRSLALKIIYVAAVFIWVKGPGDTLLYFVMTIGVVVANAVVNFVYALRFVRIRARDLVSWKYVPDNLRLGFYAIMTSMYVTFNVMYLGLVSDDLQVGYYSAAVKLYFIIVSLFGAYTNVMMPRMSKLVGEGDMEGFRRYLGVSYRIAVLGAMPVIAYCVVLAPQIIEVLSGPGYGGAVTPMRILSFDLISVWLAQVIVLQGLVPLKKDKIMVVASAIGASMALVLNISLTPWLASKGSAIVLLASDVSATIWYIFKIKRGRWFPLPSKRLLLWSVGVSVPLTLVLVGCRELPGNWWPLIMGAVAAALAAGSGIKLIKWARY